MVKTELLILLILLLSAWAGDSFSQEPLSTETVDISSQRKAPPKLNAQERTRESRLPPFGYNLFKGASFSSEREDGINPDYVIQPGDHISLRIWGATDINEVTVVDGQGNIFIENVGPIRVEGIKNGQLNRRITAAVKRVFTNNVNVYTNLQSTTSVLVYVTGFVYKPGSYAGVASDSLLYFLERAGGIDHERGSFRNIYIQRNHKQIASADLYDFLINGNVPRPQFADGDTIVVGPKGDTVSAEGAVRNRFSFEISGDSITGKELVNFARPWANATYTTVIGTRGKDPFSVYLPISDFKDFELKDGDQILFEVDQVHDTILVRVEGSHIGQSRFAVPRNTHLLDLLNYIKVDPALADTNSISIRRESIKKRQAQAINDSLNRLETAVLARTSVTTEGAEIQTREAQLISEFVKRARKVKPEGILVVSKSGVVSNILLQPDDVITIPEKTNVIQVSGEVMVPQALVYEPDNTLQDYIERVGGYTDHADEKKHMILRRNGEVIPVFGPGNKIAIQPGDEIISLPKVPSKSIDIVRMVTDIIFKVASSAAVFVRLL